MRIALRREQIPWAMASLRAALGPVMITGAACNWSGTALAGIVLSALLSDIYDGVLARRWKCDTPAVRLFDSMADTFFYGCTLLALWMGRHELMLANAAVLVGLLVAEVLQFAVAFAKFGKPASYHSYLAKGWGVTLAVAVMLAFANGRDAGLIGLTLWMGIASNLEGLAMSAILPVWRRDVRTVHAAWALRQVMAAHTS